MPELFLLRRGGVQQDGIRPRLPKALGLLGALFLAMPTIQKYTYWIHRIASLCKIKTSNNIFLAIFQLALERRFHRDPVHGMRTPAPSFKAARHRAGFRLECPYCASAHAHPTLGFHLSSSNDRASRKGDYVIMTAAAIGRIKHSIVLAPV